MSFKELPRLGCGIIVRLQYRQLLFKMFSSTGSDRIHAGQVCTSWLASMLSSMNFWSSARSRTMYQSNCTQQLSADSGMTRLVSTQ